MKYKFKFNHLFGYNGIVMLLMAVNNTTVLFRMHSKVLQTIAEKNVKLKHCRNDFLSIESSIDQKKILQRTHSTRPHPSSEAG